MLTIEHKKPTIEHKTSAIEQLSMIKTIRRGNLELTTTKRRVLSKHDMKITVMLIYQAVFHLYFHLNSAFHLKKNFSCKEL